MNGQLLHPLLTHLLARKKLSRHLDKNTMPGSGRKAVLGMNVRRVLM